MRRKRWIGIAVVLMLLAVFAAAMILGCGGEGGLGPGVDGDESAWKQAGTENESLEWNSGTEMREAQDEYAAGEGGISPSPSPSTLPQIQSKIIKAALVKMETGRGGYAEIREDALAIALAAGGYVESESSSRNDEGLTYATLTLRIPADKFDEAVAEVAELAEVISNQVSTNDVSAEYVDMESRLRHLQAEEAFYLSLIDEAQTIQEMITIREHLNSIQLEKEQVQGRMNFIDQQAGYSTLTLSVDETEADDEGEGFWNSVGDAFKSFGRGMKGLAIGLFYALPYLVILAAIGLLIWLLLRRSRKK